MLIDASSFGLADAIAKNCNHMLIETSLIDSDEHWIIEKFFHKLLFSTAG
jgi:hypothetical protein|tara:strand:+ start:164 stop:313 length:150 start_codon:yes stop_codon:yes gene_type:complete